MTFSHQRRRRTLASSTTQLEGIGLHSGSEVWVRIDPAPSGRGIVFLDHASRQEIAALVQNVFDTTRCTQLSCEGAVVQTVEHALSALSMLGIDDAVVEISGGELPAVDGSSAPYVDLILAAGVVENDDVLDPLVLDEPVEISDGRGGSLRLQPASELSITVTLEYPNHPYIGTQTASYTSMDDYRTQIAPARTFGFITEIEQLRAHGLALGASYDNALVLGPDGYMSPCRFDNELARHKILDLCGDLALIGKPLVADVVAVRPGHRLNTQMAALLAGRA